MATAKGRGLVVCSEAEFGAAMQEGLGFCRLCGHVQGPVEPDAERYRCERCEGFDVFGAEQLLIMGALAVVDGGGDAG